MRVCDLLEAAIPKLKAAGVNDGARDARVILRYVIGGKAGFLFPEAVLSREKSSFFLTLIEQRCDSQPVSQIIGKREFWGRDFIVSEETLDPRPDSELLIELALSPKRPNSILDLGTGTGCLLLTLLAETAGSVGQGVDISEAALAVARQNASKHGLSTRVTFRQSDWFQHVSGTFDLIICNPPYISEAELKTLKRDVRVWEPKIALSPGGDGLSVYRLLSKSLRKYLNPMGNVVLEIGESQAEKVCSFFTDAGFTHVEVFKDVNGKDRAIRISDCE